MTQQVILWQRLLENIRDLIMTFDRKYFNHAISHKVAKMVINLIDVLGTRPHFRSACQLQSTGVVLKRFAVDFR